MQSTKLKLPNLRISTNINARRAEKKKTEAVQETVTSKLDLLLFFLEWVFELAASADLRG
jgi:hypothetical protein